MDILNEVDDINVIMPRRNVEANIEIMKEGNIKNWTIQYDRVNLIMHVSKQKNVNTKNIVSLNNKQLDDILRSNNYIECKSNEMHGEIINIGNLINSNILKIMQENNVCISGKNHVEKIFEKYGSIIIDNTIDYECKKFCNKYNYIPFGKGNNYFDFCVFIYKTWQLSYISTYYRGEIDKVQNYIDMFLYNNIHDIDDIILDIYEDYTLHYAKYDKVRICIMHSTGERYDREIFNMVIATEEAIVPIIWETKNILCTMITGGAYLICKEDSCRNLFKGRSNQFYCKDISCIQKRDREDVRHKNK